MPSSLVRSFGTTDTRSLQTEEGFGLWREVDRVFDNLARGFGREHKPIGPRAFASEILSPSAQIEDAPIHHDAPVHHSAQAKSEVLTPVAPTPIRLQRTTNIASNGALSPVADAHEDDDCFRMIVELPGVKESDIDIEFADGSVTISAERRKDEGSGDKKHHVRERNFGTFKRRFVLPFQANPDIIEAAYADGVVTVSVPRLPETKPRTKKIGIKHT